MPRPPSPPTPPPLHEVYEHLLRTWGPQGWWPGSSRTEIVVGAVLAQNTAWSHVEKALARLRAARAMDLCVLHAAPLRRVESWLRPAGTFRIKAQRLRALARLVVDRHGGRLAHLLRQEPAALRAELLGVRGIGPETADCILLYAAQAPFFVVDAYTRRVLGRHGWLREAAGYDTVAELFHRSLPREAHVFNEFHALLVKLGKEHCRKKPSCEHCPLRRWLPRGGPIDPAPPHGVRA